MTKGLFSASMNGMKKFKCVDNCGNCCRNLRGGFDKSKLPVYFSHSKNLSKTIGVYYITRPFKMSLMLFDLEARRLRQCADNHGVELCLAPHMVAKDTISGRILVFTWNLNHDDCPFLDDSNRCLVYVDRPLLCRSFPISFYMSGKEKHLKLLGEGWCPSLIWPDESNRKTTPREVDKIYNGCAMAECETENLAKTSLDLFTAYVQKGKFHPEMGLPRKLIREEAKDQANLVGFIRWLSETSGEPEDSIENAFTEVPE